jgi:hypothetical protein
MFFLSKKIPQSMFDHQFHVFESFDGLEREARGRFRERRRRENLFSNLERERASKMNNL